jgi:hypothetical protein
MPTWSISHHTHLFYVMNTPHCIPRRNETLSLPLPCANQANVNDLESLPWSTPDNLNIFHGCLPLCTGKHRTAVLNICACVYIKYHLCIIVCVTWKVGYIHCIKKLNYVVFFLLGDSPGSEFYVATFRNTSIFIGRVNKTVFRNVGT